MFVELHSSETTDIGDAGGPATKDYQRHGRKWSVLRYTLVTFFNSANIFVRNCVQVVKVVIGCFPPPPPPPPPIYIYNK